MRKVSELVKPDDKSKAEERNSLLEQIRNKVFNFTACMFTLPLSQAYIKISMVHCLN